MTFASLLPIAAPTIAIGQLTRSGNVQESEARAAQPSEKLLHAYFFERGAEVQRSVARITVIKPIDVDGTTIQSLGIHPPGQQPLEADQKITLQPGDGLGTGFLVSPSLLLTCHHVIPDAAISKKLSARFNYQVGRDSEPAPPDSYALNPDSVFVTDPKLDFTLVALMPKDRSSVRGRVPPPVGPGGNREVQAGEVWGGIELNSTPSYQNGMFINVIQHPKGDYKRIAAKDAKLAEVHDDTIFYTAYTEPGSSGAPLFDDAWRLVGLHRGKGLMQGGVYRNNRGTMTTAIAKALRAHTCQDAMCQKLLAEIWSEAAGSVGGHVARGRGSPISPEQYDKLAITKVPEHLEEIRRDLQSDDGPIDWLPAEKAAIVVSRHRLGYERSQGNRFTFISATPLSANQFPFTPKLRALPNTRIFVFLMEEDDEGRLSVLIRPSTFYRPASPVCLPDKARGRWFRLVLFVYPLDLNASRSLDASGITANAGSASAQGVQP
jgi:V8-like Glu-specific endopeptidase